MAIVTTPIPSGVAQKAAARTVDAVKIYGKGQTEVRALDGVTVEFVTGRYTAIMGRRAPAGRRCCTAWPAWTPSPQGGPSSATPTSAPSTISG